MNISNDSSRVCACVCISVFLAGPWTGTIPGFSDFLVMRKLWFTFREAAGP